MDLAGEWKLKLDPADSVRPPDIPFDDRMTLPGSTELARKGAHVTAPLPHEMYLNSEWKFVGPAFYQRKITIPAEWKDAETELFLERVMWQSRVWIDGREVSETEDSLVTPHVHRLGRLAPGKHDLIIRVDNRMIHPIGDKGHAYGGQTQSVWNGIVGRIELRPVAESHVSSIRVFPSLDGNVTVEVNGNFAGDLMLHADCAELDHADKPVEFAIKNAKGGQVSLTGRATEKPKVWSEFSPARYTVGISLKDHSGRMLDRKVATFGFREVRSEGNQLLINGKPAFMRGNLECAVFPKTGHPPVDVESWRRIWRIYQNHGLNHARFHSWCPPEAAFTAADELGIYLQVEAPIWMDGWMSAPNPRKEMDTPGYPKGLGLGDRTNDAFAKKEIRRIIDAYGNHPSFVFFCIGNELSTTNFEVTGEWMREAKQHDPRHLYAVSTARKLSTFCEYNATHNIPDVGWCRQHVEFGTAWDYEKPYSSTRVPTIAHEIGQWPVYVDWKTELPKYTGPLKPYRLEAMAGEARKNGLYDRASEMKNASGASNRILYRYEIESFLRTPSCRGFQLLGMQDFSGQGEALVGWLDSFHDSKGTTDPLDFRRYCAPIVPLLKLPAYVFKPTDRPEIEALVSHYGAKELNAATIRWDLVSTDGKELSSGAFGQSHIPAGGVTSLGKFTPDFSKVMRPTQAKLTLRIPNAGENAYDLWIYPDEAAPPPDNVTFAGDWETAKDALAKGGRVVFSANLSGGPKAARSAGWFPLYWSVPFFPGQGIDTIGLLVHEKHPAFNGFPTPPHADWNWFRICQGARGFDVTDLTNKEFRGIAEPVCDFHINRRLASIFELKQGAGKLLVCGYDITAENAAKFPEVAALRNSLIAYAASPEFNPRTEIESPALARLFENPQLKLPPLPKAFAKADLYVSAAAKLPVSGKSTDWRKSYDAILRQAEGVDYKVLTADGDWRDNDGQAWHGKKLEVEIHPRAGVPGTLHVRFADWNHNGRSGRVTVEGKTVDLGAHIEGTWLTFPLIREDSNDGRFQLSATALSGPNLMITDIAFVPDE